MSFETPEYTGNVTAPGTTRYLEALRRSNYGTRFCQASSGEMFGFVVRAPFEESLERTVA